VRAVAQRAETLSESFDFVVSRATAPLNKLARWTRGRFLPLNRHAISNGLICLKGGDLDAELKPYARQAVVVDLPDYFEGEHFKNKKLVFLPAAAIDGR
jgi:16S rRNA (guanine527-N7)-methyltransferase